MPLRRVLSLFLLSFLAAVAIGCGSDDETYSNFQSQQNFDAPVRLGFLNVPQRAAGTTFSPIRVGILDFKGQIVDFADRPITLSLVNPNGAILSGTTTRTSVNGIAVFDDISVDKVGTYTLQASAEGLISAESATPIVITSANPGQIRFLVGPPALPATGEAPGPTTSVTKDAAFPNTIQVEVRDAQGNLVQNSATVNIVVATDGTGTTTLSGNVANTVNGVASFPNLQVETGGGVTVLAAFTSGSNVVVSDPFLVLGNLSALVALQGPNPALLTAGLFPTQTAPAPVGALAGFQNVQGLAARRDGTVIAVADVTATGFTQVLTLSTTPPVSATSAVNIILPGAAAQAIDITGLTTNPANGTIFAYVNGIANEGVYTINPTTGAATFLGAPGLAGTGEGLAFEPFAASPVMYSAGGATADGLSVINPTTGAATQIVAAAPTETLLDLAVNPFDTNLYGFTSTGQVVIINKTTGATTATPLPTAPYAAGTFLVQ